MKVSLVLMVYLLVCGCVNATVKPGPDALAEQDQPHTIFVVSYDWHSGLVLPRAAIRETLPDLYTAFDGSRYLELGWGDAGFYQSKSFSLLKAIPALFWPTGSVIHVVGFDTHPSQRFYRHTLIPLARSEAQLAALSDYITNSLSRDSEGNLVPISQGVYRNSLFFEAKGQFHLFNTCNSWTARALQSAGHAIKPWLNITPSSVINTF